MNTTRVSESNITWTPAIILMALVLPGYIYTGFIFSKLWNWFIPHTFNNVPNISWVQAIGIIIVVKYITTSPPLDKEKVGWEYFARQISFLLTYPALALLFGWIIQGWL